jgi:hypothetical protein
MWATLDPRFEPDIPTKQITIRGEGFCFFVEYSNSNSLTVESYEVGDFRGNDEEAREIISNQFNKQIEFR